MGHIACTEPQCLYKGDLYLYLDFLRIPPPQLERGNTHKYTHAQTHTHTHSHDLPAPYKIKQLVADWPAVCTRACSLRQELYINRTRNVRYNVNFLQATLPDLRMEILPRYRVQVSTNTSCTRDMDSLHQMRGNS